MHRTFRRAAAGSLRGTLEFRERVSAREYEALLETLHIGLCLKMPNNSMGQTTFPSKVIQFATWGLLVVSQRVSDVPALFPEDGAYLLDGVTPEVLAEALSQIARRSEDARQRARKGHATITARLSPGSVAAELLSLWHAPAIQRKGVAEPHPGPTADASSEVPGDGMRMTVVHPGLANGRAAVRGSE